MNKIARLQYNHELSELVVWFEDSSEAFTEAEFEQGSLTRAMLELIGWAIETLAEKPEFVGYLNTEEGRERFPEGRFPTENQS